jgi:parvulin-like peptidyl-prolyl isomerase
MMHPRKAAIAGSLLLAALGASGAAAGEIVEEIVAWVNGEIITRSEYEEEERSLLAELYRHYSGAELDKEAQRARTQLLQRMIDNKLLIHHGAALGLDMEAMGSSFIKSFMEQQKIESEDEFDRLLAQEGMTRRDIRNKLLEMYAPEQVIFFEVGQRIAVGDREVEQYYQEHQDEFQLKAEVTLSEIVLLAEGAAKETKRPQAEELRQRVLAGEDFAALAGEFSQAGTQENGGVLGPLPMSDLSESLAREASRLPVGGLSDVMETPYGFHIIRVDSRKEDRVQPLDEIREKLRDELEDRKYRTQVEEFISRVREEGEWCVKPKFQDRLSRPAPTTCEKS